MGRNADTRPAGLGATPGRPRLPIAAIATLAGMLLLWSAAEGQQAAPSTNLADLALTDVSVLDAHRQPIRGLTAADFAVVEHGTPRPIEKVTEIALPDAAPSDEGWARGISSDVATNDVSTRREVGIIVDNVVWRSRPDVAAEVKVIARRLIAELAPRDLAAVVLTGSGEGQVFTTDRGRLQSAVDAIAPSQGAEHAAGALTAMIDVLSAVPDRRKTIVYFGDGNAPGIPNAASALLRAASHANVTLYLFDANTEAPRRRTRDERAADAAFVADPLSRLAEDTGGQAVAISDTAEGEVSDVLRGSGAYYLLWLRKDNGPGEKGWHEISIRTTRADATVLARRGYVAPIAAPRSREPAMTADRAVQATLPVDALPLRMTVTPFATAVRLQPAVVLAIRLPSSPPEPPGGRAIVVAVARDGQGRTVAITHERVEVPRVAPGGFPEIVARLDVPPGTYEVRAGVDLGSVVGSVFAYATVPDVAGTPISLSGLVVTRDSTSPSTAVLGGLMPVLPTTTREFDRADRISVSARLYQGGGGALLAAAAHVTLRNADNQVVFDQPFAFDGVRFRATRAVDLHVPLPLADLTPGDYLVRIEAARGPDTVREDSRITVR